MIAHELHIGDIIWDTFDERWGKIILINGKEKDTIVEDEDEMVTYVPVHYDSMGKWVKEVGECETTSYNAYPLAKGKYFWGEFVCTEINVDEFDKDHDFEYFCPMRNENCWEFEV